MTKFKLTEADLEKSIKHVEYLRYSDSGMLCVITMQNGYTVTGQSACVDPTIFDEEIGKGIAYTNAFKELWQVLGYGLKQRWYEETQLSNADRLAKELEDLDKKRTDLLALLEKSKPEDMSANEWACLGAQLEVMGAYGLILQDRLVYAKKSSS